MQPIAIEIRNYLENLDSAWFDNISKELLGGVSVAADGTESFGIFTSVGGYTLQGEDPIQKLEFIGKQKTFEDVKKEYVDISKNYISDIILYSMNSGLASQSSKYANQEYIGTIAQYIKDKIVSPDTDIKNVFLPDPVKEAINLGVDQAKNIQLQYPLSPTSDERIVDYLEALKFTDVIDNKTYNDLKKHFNSPSTAPANPDLTSYANYLLNGFKSAEQYAITGQPGDADKPYIATVQKFINDEYRPDNVNIRSLDFTGSNLNLKFMTPAEWTNLNEQQKARSNELISQGTMLSNSWNDLKKQADLKLQNTYGLNPTFDNYGDDGLQKELSSKYNQVINNLLPQIIKTNDALTRGQLLENAINQFYASINDIQKTYTTENVLSNFSSYSSGIGYVNKLLDQLGEKKDVITEEDKQLLANQLAGMAVEMAESEENLDSEFMQTIADQLPSLKTRKNNTEIIQSGDFDSIVASKIFTELGLGNTSDDRKVKRHIIENVVPGFQSLVSSKVGTNPNENIDNIIFSGIQNLRNNRDSVLNDFGISALDINVSGLKNRLADDQTLLAMGVDPITGEVTTTTPSRQREIIDPLSVQGDIAAIAGDDAGFMNFLLRNENKLTKDYLKAKSEQAPDADEFAALGDAALRASLGLKSGDPIPSYAGGTPPGTFVGEGGNIGKFPAFTEDFKTPINPMEPRGSTKQLGDMVKPQPKDLAAQQQAAAQFAFTALQPDELSLANYLQSQKDTLRGLYEKSPEFTQSKFARPRSAFGGITYTQGRT